MIDYQENIFSFMPLSGKLWEADFVHYYYGCKFLSKLSAGSKVLDVGCGAGELTALFAKRFPKLKFTGVDISEKALNKAGRKYKRIEFKKGNAEKVPFGNDKFDAVICLEVIEHLNRPEKALNEISRVLKYQGFIYLTTPIEADSRNVYGFFHKDKKYKAQITGHIQTFSEKSLCELMSKKFNVDMIYFDKIFFGQIIDYLYTRYLVWRKSEVLLVTKNLKLRGGITWMFGLFLMRAISLLTNIEVLLFGFVPGIGIIVFAQNNK